MIKTISLIALATTLLFAQDPAPQGKHGGGFVFAPGMFWLNMDPIRELAKDEPALRNFHFNLNNGVYMLNGISGYWGHQNDTRFGFGLHAGYKRYQSDPVQLVLRDSSGSPSVDQLTGDTLKTDSMMNLMCIPATLTFLLERQIKRGDVNFFAGGAIGVGVFVVIKEGKQSSEQSAFMSEHSSMQSDNQDAAESGDVAAAPFSWMDAHGGVTYSLARWCHVGVEGTVALFMSSSGFIGGRGNGFITVNPGVRARIVLGTLG